EEARERWRSRLESLQGECAGERKVARDDVSCCGSYLAFLAHSMTSVLPRPAHRLRSVLVGGGKYAFTTTSQVEAKVEAVLQRKAEQAGALKKRLITLQGQTKAREEELSDHRRRTFS
ncbi:unnamed protein product, partial [Scytosiphon promiscuus]